VDVEQLKRLTPLITPEGVMRLMAMRQDPHAPSWNSHAGDMLHGADIAALKQFRASLEERPRWGHGDGPPDSILDMIRRLRPNTQAFMNNIHEGMDIKRDWALVGSTSREDIALRPESLIPADIELAPMVVYRTAGTTGHSLYVPNDPLAVACYQPMLEFALARHGAVFAPRQEEVACFLVGAQARTVTYPTVLSYWNGAGFAKLNMNADQWPGGSSPQEYFRKFSPAFLTGDPISFSRLLGMGLKTCPAALVTTAVAMSDGLRKTLSKEFACPVIDWYSLTETGPIGYACPAGNGYHILPGDIYVEAVDPEGAPVDPGARGEITITGGRNPYLPMLRYRTGDWAAMEHGPCACGDPSPRLMGLEGRKPVLFKRADGAMVNPVDISTALREFPMVQSQFEQFKDLSCRLVIRPLFAEQTGQGAAISAALAGVLGQDIPITIEFDPHLGGRNEDKVVSYRSDFLLED